MVTLLAYIKQVLPACSRCGLLRASDRSVNYLIVTLHEGEVSLVVMVALLVHCTGVAINTFRTVTLPQC